jgi:tripartite-type tricarboxylate transporter receptor subunit TctC
MTWRGNNAAITKGDMMLKPRFWAAAALLAVGVSAAHAETWPSRPIRLVVPFPPGGGTDAVARLIAEKMSTQAHWTVVVENRPGAGGNVGLDVVAKAAPDGYTVGLGQTANLAINPALYPRMPFDPLRDFAPISLCADLHRGVAAGRAAGQCHVAIQDPERRDVRGEGQARGTAHGYAGQRHRCASCR